MNCNFSSLTCIFGQTNNKNPKDLKKVKIMIKCIKCSGMMWCSGWDVTRMGSGWGTSMGNGKIKNGNKT